MAAASSSLFVQSRCSSSSGDVRQLLLNSSSSSIKSTRFLPPRTSTSIRISTSPLFTLIPDHTKQKSAITTPQLGSYASMWVCSREIAAHTSSRLSIVSATTTDKGTGTDNTNINEVEKKEKKQRYPGEAKGFVEEMRFVAMRLHTRDQAKEGQKEPADTQPIGKWEPSVPGYLRFLVDSKLVYDTLEGIVHKASSPSYAEFRNTGLERSEKLAQDLKWFKEQGYAIPEPSSPGITYAHYLEDLSEKDPQAFICHFYNVYFAHSAGGRMIGKKVAEKILDGKELGFYNWDGELSELLQNVRDKLNKVASSWSREEKNHCLDETERSFKYSGEILRLILS